MYSSVPNFRGRGLKLQIWGKKPQVHLIIIRDRLKSKLLILRNLDSFSPGAFYSTLLQLGTKKYCCKVFIATFQLHSTTSKSSLNDAQYWSPLLGDLQSRAHQQQSSLWLSSSSLVFKGWSVKV